MDNWIYTSNWNYEGKKIHKYKNGKEEDVYVLSVFIEQEIHEAAYCPVEAIAQFIVSVINDKINDTQRNTIDFLTFMKSCASKIYQDILDEAIASPWKYAGDRCVPYSDGSQTMYAIAIPQSKGDWESIYCTKSIYAKFILEIINLYIADRKENFFRSLEQQANKPLKFILKLLDPLLIDNFSKKLITIAIAAAKIWTNCIRNGFVNESGDATINFFQNIKEINEEISNNEINIFEEWLIFYIFCDLKECKEEDYLISIDYEPKTDSAIAKALKKTVINGNSLRFPLPIKSYMWIVPKESKIQYAFGYGDKEKTIIVNTILISKY